MLEDVEFLLVGGDFDDVRIELRFRGRLGAGGRGGRREDRHKALHHTEELHDVVSCYGLNWWLWVDGFFLSGSPFGPRRRKRLLILLKRLIYHLAEKIECIFCSILCSIYACAKEYVGLETCEKENN